jgi:hypothetical protein
VRNILITIAVLAGLYVGHDLATDMCVDAYMEFAEDEMRTNADALFPDGTAIDLGAVQFDPIEVAISARLDELYPDVVSECRRPSRQIETIQALVSSN